MTHMCKEDYLKFGIILIGNQPKYLFCKWLGSNKSMKINLLKYHPEHHEKPLEFFQRMKQECKHDKRLAKISPW